MQATFKVLSAIMRKRYYTSVGLFPPGYDLSWIPSVNEWGLDPPAETPDGIITTFTWDVAPKYVFLNGVLLAPGTGYAVGGAGGTGATFTFPPEATDIILALL